jgi:hypothetical protein
MQEGYVSRAAIVAVLLWVKAGLLVTLVWAMSVMDEPMRWMLPVALTACLAIGIAIVGQIRVSLLRVSRLVRAMSGLDEPRPEIRAVR